jgi:hypothetical protein
MICIICRNSVDAECVSPCNCSGTMKYIHKACLTKCISYGHTYCRVCKTPYPSGYDRDNNWCKTFIFAVALSASIVAPCIWLADPALSFPDKCLALFTVLAVFVIAPRTLIMSVICAGILRGIYYMRRI